ncbi:hypothetical protein [Paracoccus sp. (in: a-proteobacteria)]|uniref:hypothetical protein n=1 Tax=Paracoccus sp. TaxID=267 RepID=UPI0028B1ED7E|nr:hypothetical protein [Paracoccus sp. (in: a-proteobacteria)]
MSNPSPMPKVIINHRGTWTDATVSFDTDLHEITIDIWPIRVLQENPMPDHPVRGTGRGAA